MECNNIPKTSLFPLYSIVIPQKQTCFHRTSCAVWPWDLQHNHDSILLVRCIFTYIFTIKKCYIASGNYQQQRCSSASLCTRGRVPSVDESCNVPERRDGGAGTPNWQRQPGKKPVSFVSGLCQLTSSWHWPPPASPTAPPIRFCSADAATGKEESKEEEKQL